MAHKNRYDATGIAFDIGKRAEDIFVILAKKRDYIVRKSTQEEEFQHIDYVMTKNNQKISVDVKGKKKISRSDIFADDDLVWVEWKNVNGKNGWLHGKADLIAFEQEDHFLIGSRNQLAILCSKLVDFNRRVDKPYEALNAIYQRAGRKDNVSLVRVKDIESGIRTIRWKK